MKISDIKIDWLTKTLTSIYGIEFTLENKFGNIYLSLESIVIIIFDNLEPLFYTTGISELNCNKWDPDSERFHNKSEESLYSPGLAVDKVFSFEKDIVYCHYDILGLMFWCFNRLEEIGNPKKDQHGRFPFCESHSYKYGYIEYPIVDQWLDILKQAIEKIVPSVIFKKNEYQVILTHDVDRPARYYFKNLKGFLRASIGDFVKTKNIKNLIESLHKFTNRDIPDSDPYNTFNWIMDLSEEKGLISQFYFIAGGNSKYDADYDINSEEIKLLIERIKNRNHKIGLHPSYESFLNRDMISKEFSNLSSVVDVSDYKIGGRMHYLRFKYPDTLRNLEYAGMAYDSTLGYAEHIGFRCGTSYSYFPFDFVDDRTMDILVYPLIVMDGTLTTYMNLHLGANATLERIARLEKICKNYGGNFTLLWHNSELRTSLQKNFYQKLVKDL